MFVAAKAGGKVTDGPTGQVMLEACGRALPEMEARAQSSGAR